MNCPSRYTINRLTGERLECDQAHGHPKQHTAKAEGHTWFWATSEEDKDAASGESKPS